MGTTPRRAPRVRPPSRGANLQREERDPRGPKGRRLDHRISFTHHRFIAPRAGGQGKQRQQPARSAAGEVRPGGTFSGVRGHAPAQQLCEAKCTVLYFTQQRMRSVGYGWLLRCPLSGWRRLKNLCCVKYERGAGYELRHHAGSKVQGGGL